jgi:hypothetical protein
MHHGMVKSLIEMVTKLSCEVQELKSDNTALKLQLRDLHQFRIPAPFISTEALSSIHMVLQLKPIGMF